jgi:hypothetical protein
VKDFNKMNVSLLCKWWWKLEHEGEISCVLQVRHKASNSPVLNDLIKIKNIYIKGRILRLGNGKNIDFWHDIWCGPLYLKDRFPELFKICFDQDCSVMKMCNRNWRLSFRRWLSENLKEQLRDLHNMVFRYKNNSQADGVIWRWGKNGIFFG